MKILGIESSCDETAVAIVSDDRVIHAHIIRSQYLEHLPYGGVVPEIASRAHMEVLDTLITQALKEAHLPNLQALDGIAVTAGPGLIGGVIVGLMTAKAIASVTRLPLLAVNHLEGHALTIRLTDDVAFPYLLLLVSGGHCQILVVEGIGHYQKLGGTLDDALGEAFDKVAKILGLGYPGGPIVEQHASQGNPERFIFPRPLKGKEGCNFSFSGLKTAVKRQADAIAPFSQQDIYDICASFQAAITEVLEDRILHALSACEMLYPSINTLVIAGGVAANQHIGQSLKKCCSARGITLKAPPLALCTDNGAMIAWAGLERLKLGLTDSLTCIPKARWPLETLHTSV